MFKADTVTLLRLVDALHVQRPTQANITRACDAAKTLRNRILRELKRVDEYLKRMAQREAGIGDDDDDDAFLRDVFGNANGGDHSDEDDGGGHGAGKRARRGGAAAGGGRRGYDMRAAMEEDLTLMAARPEFLALAGMNLVESCVLPTLMQLGPLHVETLLPQYLKLLAAVTLPVPPRSMDVARQEDALFKFKRALATDSFVSVVVAAIAPLAGRRRDAVLARDDAVLIEVALNIFANLLRSPHDLAETVIGTLCRTHAVELLFVLLNQNHAKLLELEASSRLVTERADYIAAAEAADGAHQAQHPQQPNHAEVDADVELPPPAAGDDTQVPAHEHTSESPAKEQAEEQANAPEEDVAATAEIAATIEPADSLFDQTQLQVDLSPSLLAAAGGGALSGAGPTIGGDTQLVIGNESQYFNAGATAHPTQLVVAGDTHGSMLFCGNDSVVESQSQQHPQQQHQLVPTTASVDDVQADVERNAAESKVIDLDALPVDFAEGHGSDDDDDDGLALDEQDADEEASVDSNDGVATGDEGSEGGSDGGGVVLLDDDGEGSDDEEEDDDDDDDDEDDVGRAAAKDEVLQRLIAERDEKLRTENAAQITRWNFIILEAATLVFRCAPIANLAASSLASVTMGIDAVHQKLSHSLLETKRQNDSWRQLARAAHGSTSSTGILVRKSVADGGHRSAPRSVLGSATELLAGSSDSRNPFRAAETQDKKKKGRYIKNTLFFGERTSTLPLPTQMLLAGQFSEFLQFGFTDLSMMMMPLLTKRVAELQESVKEAQLMARVPRAADEGPMLDELDTTQLGDCLAYCTLCTMVLRYTRELLQQIVRHHRDHEVTHDEAMQFANRIRELWVVVGTIVTIDHFSLGFDLLLSFRHKQVAKEYDITVPANFVAEMLLMLVRLMDGDVAADMYAISSARSLASALMYNEEHITIVMELVGTVTFRGAPLRRIQSYMMLAHALFLVLDRVSYGGMIALPKRAPREKGDDVTGNAAAADDVLDDGNDDLVDDDGQRLQDDDEEDEDTAAFIDDTEAIEAAMRRQQRREAKRLAADPESAVLLPDSELLHTAEAQLTETPSNAQLDRQEAVATIGTAPEEIVRDDDLAEGDTLAAADGLIVAETIDDVIAEVDRRGTSTARSLSHAAASSAGGSHHTHRSASRSLIDDNDAVMAEAAAARSQSHPRSASRSRGPGEEAGDDGDHEEAAELGGGSVNGDEGRSARSASVGGGGGIGGASSVHSGRSSTRERDVRVDDYLLRLSTPKYVNIFILAVRQWRFLDDDGVASLAFFLDRFRRHSIAVSALFSIQFLLPFSDILHNVGGSRATSTFVGGGGSGISDSSPYAGSEAHEALYAAVDAAVRDFFNPAMSPPDLPPRPSTDADGVPLPPVDATSAVLDRGRAFELALRCARALFTVNPSDYRILEERALPENTHRTELALPEEGGAVIEDNRGKDGVAVARARRRRQGEVVPENDGDGDDAGPGRQRRGRARALKSRGGEPGAEDDDGDKETPTQKPKRTRKGVPLKNAGSADSTPEGRRALKAARRALGFDDAVAGTDNDGEEVDPAALDELVSQLEGEERRRRNEEKKSKRDKKDKTGKRKRSDADDEGNRDEAAAGGEDDGERRARKAKRKEEKRLKKEAKRARKAAKRAAAAAAAAAAGADATVAEAGASDEAHSAVPLPHIDAELSSDSEGSASGAEDRQLDAPRSFNAQAGEELLEA